MLINMNFRKLFLITLVFGSVLFFTTACEEGLNVTNPNNPTPDIVENEEGIKRVARGVYSKGGGWFEWITWQIHEHMADNAVAPWVNFNFNRFHGNPERIIYSDGTEVLPPERDANGRNQPQWIDFINRRDDPEGGVELEWQSMYRINNEANLILQTLEGGEVDFSGNAQAKERGYYAWAYFWKGYSYSRIGLAYEYGLIVDTYGSTNNNYLTPDEILEESNRMFNLAIDHASNGIGSMINDIQPAIFGTNITEASFIQAANTFIARNLISGQMRDNITQTEWEEIRDTALDGLETNDGTFRIASDEATFLTSITATWRMANTWMMPSARVVQAAKHEGDARGDLFVDYNEPPYNNRISQPHLNTLHYALPPYAGTAPGIPTYLTSAEENLLILAEAEFELGNPETAAGYIDQVRVMQGAGLPALGEATLEDIRRERRIALFMRNTGFYDARRFGELSGCVDNLWVYQMIDDAPPPVLDEEATICYGYKEYLPVPEHETVFNPLDGGQQPTMD
jgi:starch-binding outer membrane protein, SusD/RagB family